MTTLLPTSVTCGVCGHVAKQISIGSSNTFEGPDLDLRPAPMLRWTIEHWVQECPACGACARDLTKLKATARASVSELKSQPVSRDEPPLATRFVRWSRLAAEIKRDYESAEALVNAAWACDDANADAAASHYRSLAADAILTLKGNGEINRRIRTLDLLRRSGRFDDCIALCDRLDAAQLDETGRDIVCFQRARCIEQDDARHTAKDALSPETTAAKKREADEIARQASARWKARQAESNSPTILKAKALFASLEEAERTCDHCGRPGGADAFKLSVGATGAVICRRCGWPQTL